MKQILLIDNYDSFTQNLKHYVLLSGANVHVLYADAQKVQLILNNYDGVMISPGPSHPSKAKEVKAALSDIGGQKPILGICLGMQIINEFYGGTTRLAPYPMHGKTAEINILQQSDIFKDLPPVVKAARYHSLICDRIAIPLKITATYKNLPMAIQHQHFPIFGVQFHPESFMSEYGYEIINNFVRMP